MLISSKMNKKALVSTIEPIDGGVPTMTRWICNQLELLKIEPILAWYAPWRNYPRLSIPSYSLYKRLKPGLTHQYAFSKYHSYGIGCWLPELEFTHYRPSKMWHDLMRDCDLHIAVSGNALCAIPFVTAQIPFLAWVATPWEADRKDRIRTFNYSRRLLDSFVNTPILKRLEKKVLACPYGKILCLSQYTSRELDKVSQGPSRSVLYMPVQTSLFKPNSDRTVPWRIGFSGRYMDPRKNIELLFAATRILVDYLNDVQLVLVGDRKGDLVYDLVKHYQLQQNVQVIGHLEPLELSRLMQTFDVFTIPSYQEGLCISALEAMACGVPIVSTRCGGPEDYVESGITGQLSENNPQSFANSIKNICISRHRRNKLSINAVNWINDYASETASHLNFVSHLSSYRQINSLLE
jgi:glycosyltransferase involved in cell wall biosynthesis